MLALTALHLPGRLVVLCESLLVDDLKSQDSNDKELAAEYAPSLLKLADSTGLKSLQSAVLQYVSEKNIVILFLCCLLIFDQ